MNKKLTITLLLSILTILLLSTTATAQTSQLEDVRVTLLNQEPDPVSPGDTVELRFKIENTGAETKQEVISQIKPDTPFSLYTTQQNITVGQLRAGQTGSDSVIVDYQLKVSEKAVEGTNDITLRINTQKNNWIIYDDFKVDIKTQAPTIEIKEVYTNPSSITPGQPGKIHFKITNLADSLIEDINLNLNLKNQFIALNGTNEKRIKSMDEDETRWVSFKITAENNLESGIYQLPFNLTFYNTRGDKHTQEGSTGIKIGEKPQILAYIIDSDIQQPNERGTVTIELANPTTENLRFLKLNIQDNEEYTILGNNEIYLGDLDSDDIESQDFPIYVEEQTRNGELEIPIKITYRDSKNKNYKTERKLKLNLYSENEIQKYFSTGSNLTWIITIIALILIAGAYWFYRRKN